MSSVCLCTDDKISYASLMFCFFFYPEVDNSETGHARSRSIGILKKWENYYESNYYGVCCWLFHKWEWNILET